MADGEAGEEKTEMETERQRRREKRKRKEGGRTVFAKERRKDGSEISCKLGKEENKKKIPKRPKRIKAWTCTNMGVNGCVLVGGYTHTHTHTHIASGHCPGPSPLLPLCLRPLDLPWAPERAVASR